MSQPRLKSSDFHLKPLRLPIACCATAAVVTGTPSIDTTARLDFSRTVHEAVIAHVGAPKNLEDDVTLLVVSRSLTS